MAAKKKTQTQGRTVVVQQPKAAAPIIKVSAPRAAPVKHRKKHGGGRSKKSGGGFTDMMGAGIGGLVFGYVEAKFPNLPTLPLIGRAGTIAIACHFLHKNGGFGSSRIVRDTGMAAAVIAGYQLGKTGKISGDDVDGDLSEEI